MHTLQATGDVRKVSLWLGHATIQSTEVYLHADPTEKLEMLDGARLPDLRPGRFRAPDKLLAMLAGNGDGQRSRYCQGIGERRQACLAAVLRNDADRSDDAKVM